jgi:Ser/Thr protein kinase RdoA (MazF antagonist)
MHTILRWPRIRTVIKQLRIRPSEVIPPDQVREILAEYDLDLAANPQHPAVLGRSGNLVVRTPAGKAMLKRYKSSVPESAVIHEHSILTYLSQLDFPSPRLLCTRAGETFVRRHGAIYAMFPFIEGNIRYPHHFMVPAQGRRLVSEAGDLLATLNDSLEGFEPEGQNPNGFKSPSQGRWRDLSWYTDKFEACVAESPHLEMDEERARSLVSVLLERADWIRDTFYQLDQWLEAAAPPRLIIHGDYRPGNLLFRRNAPTIVLDFELARLDWRITDLAKSLPAFAYTRGVGLNLDWMKCFLDAYQARHPLALDELQLVPSAWQFLTVRRLIVCWHNYCKAPTGRHEADVRLNLSWLDWMIDQQEALLAVLAQVARNS